MKSEGQGWGLGQLADIAKSSRGALEIIEIIEPKSEGEFVSVSVSVDCFLTNESLEAYPSGDESAWS